MKKAIRNKLNIWLSCTIFSLLSACAQLPISPESAEADLAEQTKNEQQAADQKDSGTISEATAASELGLVDTSKPDPLLNLVVAPEIKNIYKNAAAYIAQNKYNQAIGILQNALKTHQNVAGLYYLLAKSAWLNQQTDTAKSAIAQSVAIQPNNYYAYNLLGVIERSTGQFEAARSAYEKAISIYPGYPASYKNLAILADIYLRDYTLAMTNYKKYESLVGETDEKLSGWIKDLERRIAASRGE